MNPRSLWTVLLLAGTVLSATAQTDPASWLGMTPDAAYHDRGAPTEVYALPVDDKRWQAVHFYADHSYLFWVGNHVWQVRLDKLWTGSLGGVTMGMARADAEAALGPPAAQGDTWSVWTLPYDTFPKKLRLVFTDGAVADAYVYRSDL